MAFNSNLIFSRNGDNSALSNERIMQLAPAVFSDSKAERLTDRYVSLHTSDLIPVMRDYGYVPVQAAQRKSRKVRAISTISENSLEISKSFQKSPENHNAHLISFARADATEVDLRPEIILYNSHDGSSSVQLYAGCYRFICSNGIVAGEGFSNRMYHSKTGLSGFEEMLRNTVENLPAMMERINALKQVQLSQEQQLQLAIKSVQTRWSILDKSIAVEDRKGSYATDATIRNALAPSRAGDMHDDAFTVFNRIQEVVMRGKTSIESYTTAQPFGMIRKARPVAAVKESIRINSELWDACEDVAFN